MKKFGLKKDKNADEADDASRNRLFGSKSKSRSPAPASSNPYATPQSSSGGNPYASSSKAPSNPYANAAGGSQDPYTNPYAQHSQSSLGTHASMATSGTAPPAYDYGGYGGGYPSDSQRRDKSPVPPGGYGGYSRDRSQAGTSGSSGGYDTGNRYGGGSYGGGYGGGSSGGGYGENPYGSTGGDDSSKLRPGGYGGLGRTKSNDTNTEAGKQALFGGARERYEKKQHEKSEYGVPPDQDPARGGDSSWNGASALGEGGQGYGAYPDRQLTAEEEEEQDVQATKDQIRFIKQQDVASTRNALRIAQQAEDTGRDTLARLGAQGDRIHNTEKNLDLSASQNRLAEEKARELKHLNRSMWAVKVNNPFTKNARERERDEQIVEKHMVEKEQREATRRAAFTTEQRHQDQDRKLRGGPTGNKGRGNLAERSKYQFEADSDDEQMEDEIDGNLDALAGAAKRLNLLSRAMGEEVESQNKHIDRIVDKADDVDIKLAMNRARLDRIR